MYTRDDNNTTFYERLLVSKGGWRLPTTITRLMENEGDHTYTLTDNYLNDYDGPIVH